MKAGSIQEYIANEIASVGQNLNSNSTFSIRDGIIKAALFEMADTVSKEVTSFLSDFKSTRFGDSLLDQLKNRDPQARLPTLDLMGGMSAELAGNLIYELFQPPEEPQEDSMYIRYLKPEKWLWLQHQKSIRFSNPQAFADDPFDSFTPHSILAHFLNELCSDPMFSDIDPEWIEYAALHWVRDQEEAKARYRISCWNVFDEHTSHLMWSHFSGARYGVAIVCPYGALRDAFYESIENHVAGDVEEEGAGLVSYDIGSLVRPPYFKRPEYKDEREIRFVAHVLEGDEVVIPLHLLVEHMRVISPFDAPMHHRSAVIATWDQLRSTLIR